MASGLLRRARKVLLIAGVAEAREMAAGLAAAGKQVTAALDRRSAEIDPEDWREAAAATRGLFAGADGLVTALKWDRIGAVVDASHPFDAATSAAATVACRALGLPLYQYERPLWRAQGPDERHVADAVAAAEATPLLARVYLGLDYTPLAAFRSRINTWFLARTARPAMGRFPLRRGDYIVAPRAVTEAHERIVMQDHRVGWAVLENAGGGGGAAGPGAASLAAARSLGLKVALIDPPERPPAPVLGERFEAVEALFA